LLHITAFDIAEQLGKPMSGARDRVDYDRVGGAGGAKRLPGHENYLVAGLGPIAADNQLIDYVCELFDVLRYRSAPWYDTVIETHLTARSLVGTQGKNRNIYAGFT
jgi:hypothetical protein